MGEYADDSVDREMNEWLDETGHGPRSKELCDGCGRELEDCVCN